jgi:hypothetical protein
MAQQTTALGPQQRPRQNGQPRHDEAQHDHMGGVGLSQSHLAKREA